MKTVISLFDHSCAWSAPYWSAGHDVYPFDLDNEEAPVDVNELCAEWFFEDNDFGIVDGILAAPPCTDFTVSGAQYWKAKDTDGSTEASVELALQVLRAVDLFQPDFWALENPVGRIHKLIPELGKARLIFDPCDYAGYMDLSAEDLARLDELRTYYEREIEFSQADLEFIKRTGAYTKRTCLWGDFRIPEKRRIEPVKVCKQGSWLQRLGGKSAKTKRARSDTPAGFAKAFFEANCWNPEIDAALSDYREAVHFEGEEAENPFLTTERQATKANQAELFTA